MTSEKAQFDAVRELLQADPPSGKLAVYSLDEIKQLGTNLPAYYAELYVTERVTEGHRMGGLSGKTAWRVQARVMAKLAANAQEARKRIHARLREAVVTVDGVESTPLMPAVGDDPIAPDNGWFSGLSEYSYYL